MHYLSNPMGYLKTHTKQHLCKLYIKHSPTWPCLHFQEQFLLLTSTLSSHTLVNYAAGTIWEVAEMTRFFPPEWLTHWNKWICVGTAGDTWRVSSGQSKIPSHKAFASISQILNCECGYDFNCIFSSPFTLSKQYINSPVQITRQGVPGPPMELMIHTWVYIWALILSYTTVTTIG